MALSHDNNNNDDETSRNGDDFSVLRFAVRFHPDILALQRCRRAATEAQGPDRGRGLGASDGVEVSGTERANHDHDHGEGESNCSTSTRISETQSLELYFHDSWQPTRRPVRLHLAHEDNVYRSQHQHHRRRRHTSHHQQPEDSTTAHPNESSSAELAPDTPTFRRRWSRVRYANRSDAFHDDDSPSPTSSSSSSSQQLSDDPNDSSSDYSHLSDDCSDRHLVTEPHYICDTDSVLNLFPPLESETTTAEERRFELLHSGGGQSYPASRRQRSRYKHPPSLWRLVKLSLIAAVVIRVMVIAVEVLFLRRAPPQQELPAEPVPSETDPLIYVEPLPIFTDLRDLMSSYAQLAAVLFPIWKATSTLYVENHAEFAQAQASYYISLGKPAAVSERVEAVYTSDDDDHAAILWDEPPVLFFKDLEYLLPALCRRLYADSLALAPPNDAGRYHPLEARIDKQCRVATGLAVEPAPLITVLRGTLQDRWFQWSLAEMRRLKKAVDVLIATDGSSAETGRHSAAFSREEGPENTRRCPPVPLFYNATAASPKAVRIMARRLDPTAQVPVLVARMAGVMPEAADRIRELAASVGAICRSAEELDAAMREQRRRREELEEKMREERAKTWAGALSRLAARVRDAAVPDYYYRLRHRLAGGGDTSTHEDDDTEGEPASCSSCEPSSSLVTPICQLILPVLKHRLEPATAAAADYALALNQSMAALMRQVEVLEEGPDEGGWAACSTTPRVVVVLFSESPTGGDDLGDGRHVDSSGSRGGSTLFGRGNGEGDRHARHRADGKATLTADQTTMPAAPTKTVVEVIDQTHYYLPALHDVMAQIEAVQKSLQKTARSMAERWNEEIQPSADEVVALRRWDVEQKFKAAEKMRKEMMAEAGMDNSGRDRRGDREDDGEKEGARVICVDIDAGIEEDEEGGNDELPADHADEGSEYGDENRRVRRGREKQRLCLTTAEIAAMVTERERNPELEKLKQMLGQYP